MIDCRECHHSCDGYGQKLCQERLPVMATAWRRRPENECGPEARLFKPKVEEKELERWIPY